jgi:hypothetical protein
MIFLPQMTQMKSGLLALSATSAVSILIFGFSKPM